MIFNRRYIRQLRWRGSVVVSTLDFKVGGSRTDLNTRVVSSDMKLRPTLSLSTNVYNAGDNPGVD